MHGQCESVLYYHVYIYKKEFYTINQLYTYIYKTFKIIDDWVKHFYWYDNTWLNICINFFYIDNIYKLNPLYFLLKIYKFDLLKLIK